MVLSVYCNGSLLKKGHFMAYLCKCRRRPCHHCLSQGLRKKERPLWAYVPFRPGGTQYTAFAFRRLLDSLNVVQSFSKKGYPFDNACCECFFKYLKKEETNRKCYHSLQELQLSIFEYIEGYYNSKRPHGALNMLTPNEAESLYWEQNA